MLDMGLAKRRSMRRERKSRLSMGNFHSLTFSNIATLCFFFPRYKRCFQYFWISFICARRQWGHTNGHICKWKRTNEIKVNNLEISVRAYGCMLHWTCVLKLFFFLSLLSLNLCFFFSSRILVIWLHNIVQNRG